MTNESLIHLERMHDSIYFNPLTFASALLSTGGAIETSKAVVGGRVKNAIAVIRPPGHHAECNRPMGFCLFDNVSIAAKVCQADYPETCRKILILDWYVLSHLLTDGTKLAFAPGMYIMVSMYVIPRKAETQGLRQRYPAGLRARSQCPLHFNPRP